MTCHFDFKNGVWGAGVAPQDIAAPQAAPQANSLFYIVFSLFGAKGLSKYKKSCKKKKLKKIKKKIKKIKI